MKKYEFAKNLKTLATSGEETGLPSDALGWYRWYAKEEDIRLLLNSENVRIESDGKAPLTFFEKVFEANRGKTNAFGEPLLLSIGHEDFDAIGAAERYYCVYVGIAKKESLYDRIASQHILARHTRSEIKYSTLSTYRQSLSTLLEGDWGDRDGVNAFLDRLVVEWNWEEDWKMGYDEKIKEVDEIETRQIESHIFPLNIAKNKTILKRRLKKSVSDAEELCPEIENLETYVDFLGRLSKARGESQSVALKKIGLPVKPHQKTDLAFTRLPFDMLSDRPDDRA